MTSDIKAKTVKQPGKDPRHKAVIADVVVATERAQQFAQMVALHLEAGRFASARCVIDRAERECHPGVSTFDADSLPITETKLIQRTVNLLEAVGIMTVGQLCKVTGEELLTAPHIGVHALEQIQKALAEVDVTWGPEAEEFEALKIERARDTTAQHMLSVAIVEWALDHRNEVILSDFAAARRCKQSEARLAAQQCVACKVLRFAALGCYELAPEWRNNVRRL